MCPLNVNARMLYLNTDSINPTPNPGSSSANVYLAHLNSFNWVLG